MNHPAIAAGRVALITGGASGIGLAFAQKLSALGMRVCIADCDEDQLANVLPTLGETASAECVNVSELAEVEQLRDKVFERYGEVALLMNLSLIHI